MSQLQAVTKSTHVTCLLVCNDSLFLWFVLLQVEMVVGQRVKSHHPSLCLASLCFLVICLFVMFGFIYYHLELISLPTTDSSSRSVGARLAIALLVL